jgi:hypothetical protein
LPAPEPGSRYVLLADQIALVRATTRSTTLRPGSVAHIELTWIAQQSLVNDYMISIQIFHRASGMRLAQQDMQPALGALPTLKWITHTRLADPHQLTLPADAPSGWADVSLTVYDAFRQTALPPLDTRMGNSAPLGQLEIVP